MWGKVYGCLHPRSFINLDDPSAFVRSAPWYRGLPPPSWLPGGKGEFNFRGQGTGDGRWFFVTGGCWLARTRILRQLDWPDRRLIKLGDDVLLGEAIRQSGGRLGNVSADGLRVSAQRRRGNRGDLPAGSAGLRAGRRDGPAVTITAAAASKDYPSELIARYDDEEEPRGPTGGRGRQPWTP